MLTSDYKNLKVWQKARILNKDIYNLTKKLPSCEDFVLSVQMRRSCVSIPSNIAEGQARGSKKEFIHHLYYSKGSAAELETQLYLCLDLGYISEDECETHIKKLEEIGRMLKSLIHYIMSTDNF